MGCGKVLEKRSIPVWGTGGREFKSRRSDHLFNGFQQQRNVNWHRIGTGASQNSGFARLQLSW